MVLRIVGEYVTLQVLVIAGSVLLPIANAQRQLEEWRAIVYGGKSSGDNYQGILDDIPITIQSRLALYVASQTNILEADPSPPGEIFSFVLEHLEKMVNGLKTCQDMTDAAQGAALKSGKEVHELKKQFLFRTVMSTCSESSNRRELLIWSRLGSTATHQRSR